MLDIVIIADFCGDFSGKGLNFRFPYIASLLSQNNEVELITSDFNHGAKTFFDEVPGSFPFKIALLHESGYSRNISIQRFISHYLWGINVNRYLKKRKKPDVVYIAIPTLFAAYKSGKFCKKNGIRFIIDIQDLWPEAFRMAFNIPLLSDILFFPFYFLANCSYKRADYICAVSKTYIDRARSVSSIHNNFCYVYLGTDLSLFDSYVDKYKSQIVYELGIEEKKQNEFWIAYCGSLCDSYDIDCVIDALWKIKKHGLVNVRFIVMGDGYKRDHFMKKAFNYEVNAFFTGNLPYEKMCALLCNCDITINPIVGNSVASIINKHADYCASGLPVVNTQKSKEYKNLIEQYNMGFNCKSGDSDDVASKIEFLVLHEKERIVMGKNARICAEELFDRNKTYKMLKKIIEQED